MAGKVAAITGLSVEYLKESKLHISATGFARSFCVTELKADMVRFYSLAQQR